MAGKTLVIVRQDGIMGGRPTFRGTRVQAETLFEYLADGSSLDEILESFPTLDRSDLQLALMQACERLMQDAPVVPAEDGDGRRPAHARIA